MAQKGEKAKETSFIIEDELLAPWIIKVNQDEYAFYKKGKEHEVSHYSNFENVIKEIAKLKTVEKLTGSQVKLLEYIEKYREIAKEITNKLNEVFDVPNRG